MLPMQFSAFSTDLPYSITITLHNLCSADYDVGRQERFCMLARLALILATILGLFTFSICICVFACSASVIFPFARVTFTIPLPADVSGMSCE
jgi:hypothetical protein